MKKKEKKNEKTPKRKRLTEREFHALIEAQNPEAKEAAWERLKKRLEEEHVSITNKKDLKKKKGV